MKIIPGSIVSSGHVVLTGPIRGSVTLEDGTVVDVTPEIVEVSGQAEADEVAHLVGLRYAEEGHPNDVERDPESGELIQQPFVYVDPATLAATLTEKES